LGLYYLLGRHHQNSKSPTPSDFDSSSAPPLSLSHHAQAGRRPAFHIAIAVILAALLVLAFWQFRRTEWHPARRMFSAVNAADFSWRNRVAAWTGAWQITATHPWGGAGWSRAEPWYENYYLAPKLENSAAIQMNDYLMLAASLGVPAWFCFAMYLWLTLRPGRAAAAGLNDDFLSATCRAGAMVLLVGFWFDGGLFKLPTAAAFWILLELGALPPQIDLPAIPTNATHENRNFPPAERGRPAGADAG